MDAPSPLTDLLNYVGVELDLSDDSFTPETMPDWIGKAAQYLNATRKRQLVEQIDTLLNEADEKTLARALENGHFLIAWRTTEGPRRQLTQIRAIVEAQSDGAEESPRSE